MQTRSGSPTVPSSTLKNSSAAASMGKTATAAALSLFCPLFERIFENDLLH